ncbi:hypothetical protein, partial [Brunnivagina elsteri]|uniref:hypothetical protein n=1 Tax=Brunnivagina elsteri TaxID=1247191 RepID=UPI0011777CFA
MSPRKILARLLPKVAKQKVGEYSYLVTILIHKCKLRLSHIGGFICFSAGYILAFLFNNIYQYII